MSISAEVSTKTQLEKALVLLAEWKFCDTGSCGFLPAIGRSFLGSRSCHEPLAMWAPNIGSPGLQRQQGQRERLKQDGCCDVNKTIHTSSCTSFIPLYWLEASHSPTHTPGDSMTEDGNTRRWESWGSPKSLCIPTLNTLIQ